MLKKYVSVGVDANGKDQTRQKTITIQGHLSTKKFFEFKRLSIL